MLFDGKRTTESFTVTLSISLGWFSSSVSRPSKYFWIAGIFLFLLFSHVLFCVLLWLVIQVENSNTQHTWAFLLQKYGLVVREVRRNGMHEVLSSCNVGTVIRHSQDGIKMCFFWNAVQTELFHMFLFFFFPCVCCTSHFRKSYEFHHCAIKCPTRSWTKPNLETIFWVPQLVSIPRLTKYPYISQPVVLVSWICAPCRVFQEDMVAYIYIGQHTYI